MLKINDWKTAQRMESLRQMDNHLRDMSVGSRDTIWQKYGGGLKATAEETRENWEHIAKDDELYLNALFYYMVATLEPQTLKSFGVKQSTEIKGKGQLCPFTKAKLYAIIGGE